jgi:cell fate regulator YaaT (PSP1 superfamily)
MAARPPGAVAQHGPQASPTPKSLGRLGLRVSPRRPQDERPGMGCQGCSFAGQSTARTDAYVGVRFGEETNLTLCGTGGLLYARGDEVIVELEGGPTFGRVEKSPMPVFKPCQKSSARPLLRHASDEDRAAYERQQQNQERGRRYCQERARELGLVMKVSRVDFDLGGKSAACYFTAEGRVDFRQLVRDMSRRFRVRVRMVQVGARDEAKLLGGIGICGRTLCCSTWLEEFRPISIQMAKRQELSLNPSKISGQCGRLLCCLAYEDDQYQVEKEPKGIKGLPVVS